MQKNVKRHILTLLIVIPLVGIFFSYHFFSDRLASGNAMANPVEQNVALAQAISATDAPTAPPVQEPAAVSELAQQEISTAAAPAQEVAIAAAPVQETVAAAAPNTIANAKAISCTYPSQILDLTNWKETLPSGSSEKPTEIKQAALKSFVSNPYFYPNSACDGVVFRAPVNGVSTSGSGYPRSELREMSSDGKNLASWATNSGVHSMTIDEAITAVPKNKKHVVAGQIHDADDDVVVIRLEYPKLFVDINGQTGPTLDANYTLGKRFTVKFAASNGQINIFYNGSPAPAHTIKRVSSGNYFKAGAYTQSNCSKEKDCDANNFGEVVIYKLAVQ